MVSLYHLVFAAVFSDTIIGTLEAASVSGIRMALVLSSPSTP